MCILLPEATKSKGHKASSKHTLHVEPVVDESRKLKQLFKYTSTVPACYSCEVRQQCMFVHSQDNCTITTLNYTL